MIFMYYWSKFPFVRVVLFFILGILLGVYLPGYNNLAIAGLVTSIIVFITLLVYMKRFLVKLNPLYGSTISLSFLFFGYTILWQATESNNYDHINYIDEAEYYSAKLISEPERRGEYLRVKTRVDAIRQAAWIEASGKVLIYLRYDDTDTLLSYGDQILVKGFPNRVEPPGNPYEFDYRQYLVFNNIYHQDFVNRGEWTISNHTSGFSLISASINIRNRLELILAKYIQNQDELAIAKALVLGNKEDLDKSTREIFATAGAMHVLAVSGLHVGIIYLVLISLLGQKRANITRPLLLAIVAIPTLWLYAFVTGLSPSVLRAVTMFSFLILGYAFGRRSNTLNTLAISAFILLLFDPYMIMTVGFQLSYVAVIGIVLMFPVIERWYSPSNRLLSIIWQITAISIAAQVATFPLSAMYFHRFPTYFLVSNLLVIPAATIIVWGGLLLLLAGSFSGFLGAIIGKALSLIIAFVDSALASVAKWPFADIQNIATSIFESWLTYGIIIMIFLLLAEKKQRYLYLTFSLILVLIIDLVYVEVQRNNITQITIYSINNRNAIDLVEDRHYQTIMDKELGKEPDKIDFHITPLRRYYNLQPTQSKVKISETLWGSAFVWNNYSILIANSEVETTELPVVFDLVIYKPPATYKDSYREQIVLRKLVEDHQTQYVKYNLQKEGALVIKI